MAPACTLSLPDNGSSSQGDVDRYSVKSYSGIIPSRCLQVSQDNIEQLEHRVDELIAACRRLKSENELLSAGKDNLLEAHAALKERARRARGRIESVISRLKALERSDRS